MTLVLCLIQTWACCSRNSALSQNLDHKMLSFMCTSQCNEFWERAQNISWREHSMLERIYNGELTPLSFETLAKICPVYWSLLLADKKIISSLILWCLVGKVNWCKLTYPEVIAMDSGLDTRNLSTAMVNCGVWEEISMNVPSTTVVKGW